MKHVIVHQIGRDKMTRLWHATSDNLLLYVYEGSGSIVFDEKIYPIKKGALCFIKKGCNHYTMPYDNTCYDRSKLFFSAQLSSKIGSLVPTDRMLARISESKVIYAEIPPSHQLLLEEFFLQAQKAPSFGDAEDLMFASSLLALLAYLEKYRTENIFTPKNFCENVVNYINNNISNEIKIEHLCDLTFVSKYHLCRSFKKTTGMTIMKYILHTRLTLSKEQLYKNNLSIQRIATDCGFSSLSYFSRVFKDAYGETPSEFRRKKGV